MQRGRAPQTPMYGGNDGSRDGSMGMGQMGGGGNNYQPGAQIPRVAPGAQYENPAPMQSQPSYMQGQGNYNRPSAYPTQGAGVSINCKVGSFSVYDLTKVLISEFLGTFILLFVGCSGGVITPITLGAAIAISSIIFGDISGAHINPAVTIAAMIMGEMKTLLLVPFYFLGQIAGGFAGYAAHHEIMYNMLISVQFNPFETPTRISCLTGNILEEGEAFGMEFLMSTIYIMAICAMWDRKSNDNGSLIPLKRAFIYTAIVLCNYVVTESYQLSSVSMNSIRSFVPTAYNNLPSELWDTHWIYWAGPNLGAVLGAALYRLLKWLHDTSVKRQ